MTIAVSHVTAGHLLARIPTWVSQLLYVDFKLKSYVLALKHIEKSHTSDNLLAELREVMSAWDIRKKVVTVSADSAYNIKGVRTF